MNSLFATDWPLNFAVLFTSTLPGGLVSAQKSYTHNT